MRFELTSPRKWYLVLKSRRLVRMVGKGGIEPQTIRYERRALPLSYMPVAPTLKAVGHLLHCILPDIPGLSCCILSLNLSSDIPPFEWRNCDLLVVHRCYEVTQARLSLAAQIHVAGLYVERAIGIAPISLKYSEYYIQ